MINKRLKESEIFSTQELSLVAALITWGFTLDAIDKTNPSKAKFLFRRNSLLDQAIQSFWSNTAQVFPKTYFHALREVKSRIYGN